MNIPVGNSAEDFHDLAEESKVKVRALVRVLLLAGWSGGTFAYSQSKKPLTPPMPSAPVSCKKRVPASERARSRPVIEKETPFTRYARVRANCFDREYASKWKCDYQPYDSQYSVNPIVDPVIKFLNVQTWAGMGKAGRAIKDQVAVTGPGKQIHKNLIREALQFSKTQNFTDCQKACLSLCLSGFMLDEVGGDISTRSSSIEGIIEKGEGDCVELARLTSDFGSALGLKVKTASNVVEGHAFNYFELQGAGYFADAGENGCVFFPAKADR
jgi:hypothetical protein